MSHHVSYSFDTELQKLSFLVLAKKMSLKEFEKILHAKEKQLAILVSKETETTTLFNFKKQMLVLQNEINDLKNRIKKIQTTIETLNQQILILRNEENN
ncbi:hypothetical protein OF376_01750 [Ureaplasma miroungigenitalium]|uniref:Uncharacterized protein n=1 Tax=Ureaplasma miroungigenitalium TaxID=1042321 RepID=A0ABT3BMK8_9BACT|nr:hypothetical protein [Ureaplasma miroungigenitalium]MCV3728489.1 hypothetical protein [Ureaplasma miroungigenitalium]MCV3734276.1 hypothetical protein [Ureaplasma miroungigenitalium]